MQENENKINTKPMTDTLMPEMPPSFDHDVRSSDRAHIHGKPDCKYNFIY